MVTKDYKPSMEPKLIPADPARKREPSIQVSGPLLEKLKLTATAEQFARLRNELISYSMCPELYTFEDTPWLRELLGVK